MSTPAAPPRTQSLTGVKPEDVATVTAIFNAQIPPPTSVVSTAATDGSGTFTVTATWANG
jgi:hypothetical protein